MANEKGSGDLDVLLEPSVEIDLGSGFGKAKIFSFGARHLSKYAASVAGAVAMLAEIQVDKGGGTAARLQYMAAMGPFLMCNLLPLIAECVSFEPKRDITSLPHWKLPKIIEAWVDLNLGDEEKRRPWMAVVETLVKKIAKKDVRISEMFSRTSSKPGTSSETSSIAAAPAGPTGDGASEKSPSGPSAPSASVPAAG